MLTAARFQLLSIFAALPMLMLDLAAEPGANVSLPLPVGVAEHRATMAPASPCVCAMA
eukprot:COSAG02_NODE_6284_length_3679_cov_1.991620_1_plen_58_part_00